MSAQPALVLISAAEGGVADYARDSIAEWERRGWSVEPVAVGGAGAPAAEARRAWRGQRDRIERANAVHVELGSNDLGAFFLARRATRLRPDVTVTAHDPPRLVLHPGAGLVDARRAGRGRLAHRALAPLLDGRLRAGLLEHVGAWVVLGRSAAREWEASIGAPVVAAPHGATTTPAGTPPSAGDHVLFAGYLGPRKGVDVLLDAWITAGPRVGLPLVIAGRPGEGARDWVAELRARADAAGAEVRWAGWLEEERLAEHFATAAVVALPYLDSSPASGVLTRALACGRAVVATRTPAALELLEDGRDARLVEPGDPDGLAEAILALAGDPAERDRLGAAAGALAREQLDWDRYVSAVLEARELT